MIGEVLLVGGFAAAVVSVFQRSRVAPEASQDLRPETAIRDALRGSEAATVRAEFRGRGIQPPEHRLDALPFGWL